MLLCDAARDDRKFLTFDAQQYSRFWKQRQANSILDNTTLLLQYLARLQADDNARHEAALRHNFCDLSEFDKYLANLEHLVRCLQQVALEALVQNTLEQLASSANYWYKWLGCAHTFDDWYSEWSSGRPPLNSTMPWNIKASLVVLWGVCWMFYDRTWLLQNQDSNWLPRTSVSTDEQAIGNVSVLYIDSYAYSCRYCGSFIKPN